MIMNFEIRNNTDAVWLNKQIKEHVCDMYFSDEQKIVVVKLINEISYGYQHTISR